MKLILSAALVAMLFLSIPALAHHSFNTFFDMSKTVQIEGVVKSFKLISPHSEMVVEVEKAGGQVETWRITAEPARSYEKAGWKVESSSARRSR
jgi:hypothetical protein